VKSYFELAVTLFFCSYSVAVAAQYGMIPLGTFTPSGINNSGQVSGTIGTNSLPQGIIWENGTTRYLGTLGLMLPGHNKRMYLV